MWATRSRARDGSGMAALRIRATNALRPGARSRNSELIPSFVSTAAMYFAVACSLPGGLVVSMRMRSASQASSSLARAVVSPAGERVDSTVGTAVDGAWAAEGWAVTDDDARNARARARVCAWAGTKMCILRFQFTKTSSVLDGASASRTGSANVLRLTCFILTCRCGGTSAGLARRCVNSNGAQVYLAGDEQRAGQTDGS